jgi:hypothetical protein
METSKDDELLFEYLLDFDESEAEDLADKKIASNDV